MQFVERRRSDLPVEGLDDGTGYSVYGYSRINDGVVGGADTGNGVYGLSTSRYGVFGLSYSGDGVYGRSDTGYGVRGQSNSRYGVFGQSESGYGVVGTSNYSVGVAGYSYDRYGVVGESYYGRGVYGLSYGGYAMYALSTYGPGVYGESFSNDGVIGQSYSGAGVLGWTRVGYGVHGYSESEDGYGVYGESPSGIGVSGSSFSGIGLYGYTSSGGPDSYAAYLDGRVYIRGPLEKPGGSFKIDHPLDPANKYLSHSFVESPDMKNVYDGVVTLDNKGDAVIELPDWFGALNKDFRYQLTAIEAPGPNLYIAEEICDGVTTNDSSNNSSNSSHFKIAGGTSGMKVSWQVTGIRKDPWANAHRIKVEEDKPDKERGYYIYPDLYGKAAEKGISRLLFPQEEKQELLLINDEKKLT